MGKMYKATAILLDGNTLSRTGKTEEVARDEIERVLYQTRQQADHIKVEKASKGGR